MNYFFDILNLFLNIFWSGLLLYYTKRVSLKAAKRIEKRIYLSNEAINQSKNINYILVLMNSKLLDVTASENLSFNKSV